MHRLIKSAECIDITLEDAINNIVRVTTGLTYDGTIACFNIAF